VGEGKKGEGASITPSLHFSITPSAFAWRLCAFAVRNREVRGWESRFGKRNTHSTEVNDDNEEEPEDNCDTGVVRLSLRFLRFLL
jgi:hypothetical protein